MSELNKTEVWYECPICKKETPLGWDTLSLAGKFTEQVKCSCGAIVNIKIEVSWTAPSETAERK